MNKEFADALSHRLSARGVSKARVPPAARQPPHEAMSPLEAATREDARTDYERTDDALFEMYKRGVWWVDDASNPDISKAPEMWRADEYVPKFVQRAIATAIDTYNSVYGDFQGISQSAAQEVQSELRENLQQPQGWSVGSLVDDLTDSISGMDTAQATNVARTETSGVLNSAREAAYRSRDGGGHTYYWSGPSDRRTTDICRGIKSEIDSRGGSIPLAELRRIIKDYALNYEAKGGLPKRADDYVPHYQCRHTFVRDVKGNL